MNYVLKLENRLFIAEIKIPAQISSIGDRTLAASEAESSRGQVRLRGAMQMHAPLCCYHRNIHCAIEHRGRGDVARKTS